MKDDSLQSYRTRSRIARICMLALALAVASGASAQAADWRFVEMQVENDFLFPTGLSHSGDRYYTSGFRAVWLRDQAVGAPQWAEGIRGLLCGADDTCLGAGQPLIGFAIGQQSFTPDELSLAEAQPEDRPWAGFLFGSMILQFEGNQMQQVFSLQIGVTGPPSGAESLQHVVHEVIGDERAAGWDNQLPFEPTANLYYLASRRLPIGSGGNIDVVPHVGAALGTVMTYANAGATIRIGKRLRGFPHRSLEYSTINQTIVKPVTRSSYYFFAAADGRAVARNLFLDGTFFRSSPSVHKRSFVYDLSAGFVWESARGQRLTFSGIWRSEEFRPPRDQRGTHGFISMSATFPFS